jgi:DNA repair protein SbcC/Rad50
MRLLSLELKNIRSYRQQRIEFPEGITLLSGDIGAGKSTLLLAIEFALFGISRGELVGNALLRHGASDGTVLLRFSVNGDQYAIMRSLRRSSGGVLQDTGWIEHAGNRQVLTPSELRAKIYEILNYPLQFLAKQRNTLYRFTIYTPQEEMKSILTQANEERLETIRRLFNVDAYRIARDNAHLVAKALKDREVVHESLLQRAKLEEQRLQEKLLRQVGAAQQLATFQKDRDNVAVQVSAGEAALAAREKQRLQLQHEQQIQAMQERNQRLLEQEIGQLGQQQERKVKLHREAKETLLKLREGLALLTDGISFNDGLQTELALAQSGLEQLRQEEGKVLAIIDQCRHPLAVKEGATCPTCRQTVRAEHLHQVQEVLAAQEAAALKKQEKLQEKTRLQRQRIEELQGAQQRQRQVDELRSRLQVQERTVLGYEEDLRQLDALLQAKRQSSIPVVRNQNAQAQFQIAEQQWLEARAQLQRSRQQLLDVERQIAKLEQEQQELAAAQVRLDEVRAETKGIDSRLARDGAMRGWLSRQFTPFSATVERHVLMSIHATFDAVFRQWFSRMIEDDNLSTRIDHDFTPVMSQLGYETDLSYLSGGERTAVSLAYRLALVHTIHVLSPHLGTAGLIMLDEPTDGFSSEQLERMRDVLRDLRMEQIILVSHEQQLEGFVDHILRIRKQGEHSAVEIAA